MGQLRDRMHADLTLRRYAKGTVDAYLRCAEVFVAFYLVSPLRLGEAELRGFLLQLIEKEKAGPARHKMFVAALKFLYGITRWGAPRWRFASHGRRCRTRCPTFSASTRWSACWRPSPRSCTA